MIITLHLPYTVCFSLVLFEMGLTILDVATDLIDFFFLGNLP